MDIKILDSWLREYLQTKAKPKDIAKALSLTSASIEKIEAFNKDYLYHIEVTTNRVDMASVIGIAREAAAVLPQFGFDTKFNPSNLPLSGEYKSISPLDKGESKGVIDIINNDKLVKRICCVVMEVTQKESPQYIKNRLEAAGIRSLNNLIDITNYVMLEIGHPTHVFDYDRLTTKKLIIREAKKGERIVTLDKKQHTLQGGDIVADNGKGEIVDLLGVMGTYNSVVTDTIKHILFFIDNNDPIRIRKTSMCLGIRTEAAGINEKNVDPELAIPALLRGIELYQQTANAKIISSIIDIYPKKIEPKTITVTEEKINQVIGVKIPLKHAKEMLKSLNFEVKHNNNVLHVTIPSFRDADMHIAEDVVEEIARMYGYHNVHSQLPPFQGINPYDFTNDFYWEQRAKEALKYWGFSEVYTYSLVSETVLLVSPENAVKLKNPLDETHQFMRTSLTPSLLEVIHENKSKEDVKIFEIANVYHKKLTGLPDEIRTLTGVIKGNTNFFTVKGIIVQLTTDLGIHNLNFRELAKGELGTDIYVSNEHLGEIKVLENNEIVFELNFALLTKHATLRKTYTPLAKYPPVIEDMAFIIDIHVKTGDIIAEIKKQSTLIMDVSLLDQYEDKRTFHILYQHKEKNLTNEEVGKIRGKIVSAIENKFGAKIA